MGNVTRLIFAFPYIIMSLDACPFLGEKGTSRKSLIYNTVIQAVENAFHVAWKEQRKENIGKRRERKRKNRKKICSKPVKYILLWRKILRCSCDTKRMSLSRQERDIFCFERAKLYRRRNQTRAIALACFSHRNARILPQKGTAKRKGKHH